MLVKVGVGVGSRKEELMRVGKIDFKEDTKSYQEPVKDVAKLANEDGIVPLIWLELRARDCREDN